MSRRSLILVLALLLIFQSCAIPPKEFDSRNRARLIPRGEKIKVTAEDQKKWEGEFLFHDEQFIYFLIEHNRMMIGI